MKNNESFGMSVEYLLCVKNKLNIDKIKNRTETQFIENRKLSECIDTAIKQLPKIIEYVGLEKKSEDFILIDNQTLSVKSNMNKNGKVCPQVIGQPTKNKFCEHFKLDLKITTDKIKEYIVENIDFILEEYCKYLFDSDYLLWIYKDKDNYNFKIMNKNNSLKIVNQKLHLHDI